MKTLIIGLFCLLVSQWTLAENSNSYSAGDTINAISLLDQHDKNLQITDATQVVLFSRSMEGGDIIKNTLQPLSDTPLPVKLVYVADISAMPSLIARFVAVPQMQDYPFSVGLDREGEISQSLPAVKDMATMIVLDHLHIIDIAYFDSSEVLSRALLKLQLAP